MKKSLGYGMQDSKQRHDKAKQVGGTHYMMLESRLCHSHHGFCRLLQSGHRGGNGG